MSEPFAIRIAGPSGATWYLDTNADRGSYENRQRFSSHEWAETFLDLSVRTERPGSDSIVQTLEQHFRAQGFMVDVVNVEGP